jgi:hypothetical protein
MQLLQAMFSAGGHIQIREILLQVHVLATEEYEVEYATTNGISINFFMLQSPLYLSKKNVKT